jgi:hypothetical protein
MFMLIFLLDVLLVEYDVNLTLLLPGLAPKLQLYDVLIFFLLLVLLPTFGTVLATDWVLTLLKLQALSHFFKSRLFFDQEWSRPSFSIG